MIILPLTILIPFVIFQFIGTDKVFFSWDLLTNRFNDQFYWFDTGEFSAHMYMLDGMLIIQWFLRNPAKGKIYESLVYAVIFAL